VILSGALGARLAGVPHVWHIREDVSHHALAFRTISRLSSRVIANSAFTKLRFPPDVRDGVVTVYNGFRLEEYETRPGEKDAARKKYGLGPEDLVVSLVGNINDRKGQWESLAALPDVLTKFPNVKMVFAGECYDSNRSYQEKLDGFIAEKRLRDAVRFTGFVENVSEIYKMTDLLIVPSNYEAFGRVVVEGMLFGVPVIGTNVCGIPEIIENGKTGVLIDTREPAVLGAAIISALSDRAGLQAIAEAGRRSARERFRVETTVAGVEREILAAGRRHV
jgi:glycosyltransferase involved in cell wall biosynthesis